MRPNRASEWRFSSTTSQTEEHKELMLCPAAFLRPLQHHISVLKLSFLREDKEQEILPAIGYRDQRNMSIVQ